MNDITTRVEGGHRHWADVNRGHGRPTDRPETSRAAPQTELPQPILGSGPLTSEIIRIIAAIEVPAKEEVAKSIPWVTERIASSGGGMLAAQANVQPPRALALLTDAA
jgi:hypothetical protein